MYGAAGLPDLALRLVNDLITPPSDASSVTSTSNRRSATSNRHVFRAALSVCEQHGRADSANALLNRALELDVGIDVVEFVSCWGRWRLPDLTATPHTLDVCPASVRESW